MIWLFLGFIGVLDTVIVLSLNGGRNLGTLLPGFLGAIMFIWGLTGNYLQKRFSLKRFPWLRRLLLGGAILLGFSFLLIEGLLLWNTKDQTSGNEEYLIILGAGLNGDQLSWTLWERVNKGLTILLDNPEMKVVVSGGQGPGEWITEAEAMQRYLLEHGIAPERIFKEEHSTSTMENFRYTRETLEKLTYKQGEPVLVITNDFHMFRAKILAKRCGLSPVGVPSPTPWYLRPNVYLREYFAVVKSLTLDW